MGQQTALFNTMEVLEVKPLSELISEVIIKVCYVQDTPNANNTVITRDIGKEIAATLPGAPVAGFFNKDTNDFVEHSRKITFENGNFSITDLTQPYGFVDPSSSPWYEDYEENGVTRTYLVCKAYLWTRQYEEAAKAIGKGQSMELDENAMSGYYQGDVFIFTHVTLDKLCILGDAYAPCFEGAKILSNYVKQFEDLSEKLENTLGRRYYVMGEKLVAKPENMAEVKTPVSLNYALELGWNLSDAVYAQLMARGMGDQYSVNGVFIEGSTVFTILRDRETLELLRCDIIISDQDTVELASAMSAVTMTWTPKAPAEPQGVTPLQPAGAATPTMDAPLEQVNAFTKTEEAKPEAAPEVPAEVPADFTKTEAAPEVPAEPTKNEAPAAEVPTIDYTAIITEKDTKIAELEAAVATYKAAEEAGLTAKKEELIATYKEMLTEEEMAPVVAKVAEYSLDDLESKFAVLYARKARSNPAGLQVNINSLDASEDSQLPEFMKQALEYDKSREIKLI